MLTETCTVKTRSCSGVASSGRDYWKLGSRPLWLHSDYVLPASWKSEWGRTLKQCTYLFGRVNFMKVQHSSLWHDCYWLLLVRFTVRLQSKIRKKKWGKKIYSLAEKDTILRSDSMRWAWYGLGSVHLNLQQARKATAVFKKYSLSSS